MLTARARVGQPSMHTLTRRINVAFHAFTRKHTSASVACLMGHRDDFLREAGAVEAVAAQHHKLCLQACR